MAVHINYLFALVSGDVRNGAINRERRYSASRTAPLPLASFERERASYLRMNDFLEHVAISTRALIVNRLDRIAA